MRWPETVPCGSCPWRRANPPGGSNIPGFGIELMRGLACTVGPDDAFRTIMACHGSAFDDERPCVGYLARHGWSNLSVRLAAARGELDLRGVDEACAGLDLWPDLETMLAAYEAALNRRSRGLGAMTRLTEIVDVFLLPTRDDRWHRLTAGQKAAEIAGQAAVAAPVLAALAVLAAVTEAADRLPDARLALSAARRRATHAWRTTRPAPRRTND